MNNKFHERARGVARLVTHRVALKTFGLRFAAMALICFGFSANAGPADAQAESAAKKTPATIPWSQLGAKAGADYKGDGSAVVPTAEGARLRCVFQRLEGEATSEGLWLSSTVGNTVNDRFRILAAAIGRLSIAGDEVTIRSSVSGTNAKPPTAFYKELAREGTVTIEGRTVRFIRPGLTEEYSVSMDGVRQDFVLEERPGGVGKLAVRLTVSGATIESALEGAQLVLENSKRKIAYNRLRVTDATGKEVSARMEFSDRRDAFHRVPIDPRGNQGPSGTRPYLVLLLVDSDATYPLRIDPTFSDANWINMGDFPGADSTVRAATVDKEGDLYIGGDFTLVGGVLANGVAKWDRSSWSALSSGMNAPVSALAASGGELYAGGAFTTAGGSAANYVAKWNGSNWSALGSGMSGPSLFALAVSGSDLYAGGTFTNAGGSAANYIAKWNGSSWSTVGSGMNSGVYALVVSGSDLYAGGNFTMAGSTPANKIAKWNGTSWNALGSGMNGLAQVHALAVSGSDVYAGGSFTTAGGSAADYIAKWNGSNWSALGSGVSGPNVYALAVSGSNLYAGGAFQTAGSIPANYIAKWDGGSWSALGSGMNSYVKALAMSGKELYSGGAFTIAGEKVSTYAARAFLGDAPGYNQLSYALSNGGTMQLSYVGYPATNYALDRTFNLSPPIVWNGQQTNTMSISGVTVFTNAPVPGTNNFWRVRSVP